MNEPWEVWSLPRSMRFIAAIYITMICVFAFELLKPLLRVMIKYILSSASKLSTQQNSLRAWSRSRSHFGAHVDQPRSLHFQSNALCQLCEGFLKSSRLVRGSSTLHTRQVEYHDHYPSLTCLQVFAEDLCQICRLLWISVEKQKRNTNFDVDDKFRISPQSMVDIPLRKKSGGLYFPVGFAFEIRNE